MEKIIAIKTIDDEYKRANVAAGPSHKYPYGTVVSQYKNKRLPSGIFVMSSPEDCSIFPSVYGVTAERLLNPKRLCITSDCTVYNIGCHYVETSDEIYLINTGADVLRMGEAFYVTLPDPADAAVQMEFSRPSYSSTFGAAADEISHDIWGGVLATRRLDSGSALADFTRRLQELPDAAGVHEIVSPSTASGVFGLCRMIAAAGVSGNFPANAIASARNMITGGANVPPGTVAAMLDNASVTYYISEIMKGLNEISGVLYGYGAGVVIRPATGHTTEGINPGEGFWAKITRLSQI